MPRFNWDFTPVGYLIFRNRHGFFILQYQGRNVPNHLASNRQAFSVLSAPRKQKTPKAWGSLASCKYEIDFVFTPLESRQRCRLLSKSASADAFQGLRRPVTPAPPIMLEYFHVAHELIETLPTCLQHLVFSAA